MRKLLLATSFAFIVTGCAATMPPVTGSTPSGDIIANAQALAARFCNIGPTAASIINIFVSNSILTTAEELAQAFCQAIAPKPSLTGAARPLVRGVVLKGTYRGKPIAGTIQ